MHQLSTPEARFGALLAADASRPFVTYYDESTGERSELSVRSLANWVAKTHHLLGTELGLGVGDRAAVALPAHWLAVPVLLGALSAGLALDAAVDAAGDAAGDAEVAFVVPGTEVAAADVYAINPAAAALGFRDAVPEGVLDYVAAVRPQADAWATVHQPAGPDDPCLPGLTRASALELARSRAAALGLADGGRLLTTRDWHGPDDWVSALLAPLAVGGSLVIVRNADAETLSRRVSQERATAVLT